MLLRYAVGFYLVFNFLPLNIALVFCFVYAYSTGYYMGLVFAPNHKGMYIVPENEEVKWYHQIVCTRNLFSTPFTFHFMGGLDFQIEHHLFPNMPRINYPQAAPYVKEFCKKNNLEYYETSWWQSMKEIFTALKDQAKKA
jgi:fatty acid desaturase